MSISSYCQTEIDRLYPEATMIKPMRVWSLPKHKKGELVDHCNSGDYFAQIKKDGFFYSFNKTASGSYLFSRNESTETGMLSEKSANVPHIVEALSSLPDGTLVIGEIYVPGGTSKDTTRIMGCLPQKAIERQKEEGEIYFYIHDILLLKDVPLLNAPAYKRYQVLRGLMNKLDILNKYSFIQLAEIYEENLCELIVDALDRGEEGVILKHKEWSYVPEKKPAWSAIKCKKEDFADVVCIGFEDATKEYTGKDVSSWEFWEDPDGNRVRGYHYGQSKYIAITKPYFKNWKTAIEIGAYSADGELVSIGTVSSGLTDKLREEISTTPEDFIGRTLMVECMEKDIKAKTLRHPRFQGFRIDKDAKECTIEDIFL